MTGSHGGALDGCRDALLQALRDRHAGRARDSVATALAHGVAPEAVLLDVVPAVLAEIGHQWAVDALTVAEEHFATAVVQEIVASLAPAVRREPQDGRLAIVSATPGELHALGGNVVSLMLEGAGWEVLWLGASTPPEDLAELVSAECPDLVALSTSTAGRLPGVAEVLGAVTAVRPRPLVAVGGGLYAPEARRFALELGADLVTSDVRELLDVLVRRFPDDEGPPGA